MKYRYSRTELPVRWIPRISEIEEQILRQWPLEEHTQEERYTTRDEEKPEVVRVRMRKECIPVENCEKYYQKCEIISPTIYQSRQTSGEYRDGHEHEYIECYQEIVSRPDDPQSSSDMFEYEHCEHDDDTELFQEWDPRYSEFFSEKNREKCRKWEKNDQYAKGKIIYPWSDHRKEVKVILRIIDISL